MVAKIKLSSLDFHQDIFVVLPSKRWLSTQHDVQNDSNTPHIAHVGVLTLENLRGDVVSGSINLVHELVVVIKHLRCSEINNLDSALLLSINQNVLWL